MLNNTDVTAQVYSSVLSLQRYANSTSPYDSFFKLQVLELIRNPDLIEEVMQNDASDIMQAEPSNPETITVESDGLQKATAKTQEQSLKPSQVHF